MSMIDDILERFGVPRPKKATPAEPVVYTMGGESGDEIQWCADVPRDEVEGDLVVGWKQRIPQRGDLLRVPLLGGKVLRYEFLSIRRHPDPSGDMFLGIVELVGYEGSS